MDGRTYAAIVSRFADPFGWHTPAARLYSFLADPEESERLAREWIVEHVDEWVRAHPGQSLSERMLRGICGRCSAEAILHERLGVSVTLIRAGSLYERRLRAEYPDGVASRAERERIWDEAICEKTDRMMVEYASPRWLPLHDGTSSSPWKPGRLACGGLDAWEALHERSRDCSLDMGEDGWRMDENPALAVHDEPSGEFRVCDEWLEAHGLDWTQVRALSDGELEALGVDPESVHPTPGMLFTALLGDRLLARRLCAANPMLDAPQLLARMGFDSRLATVAVEFESRALGEQSKPRRMAIWIGACRDLGVEEWADASGWIGYLRAVNRLIDLLHSRIGRKGGNMRDDRGCAHKPAGLPQGVAGTYDKETGGAADSDLTPPAAYYDGRMDESARETWAEGLDAVNDHALPTPVLPPGLDGWRPRMGAMEARGDGWRLRVDARLQTGHTPDDPIVSVSCPTPIGSMPLSVLRAHLTDPHPMFPGATQRARPIRPDPGVVDALRAAVGSPDRFDASGDMMVGGMRAHIRHGRDDDLIELRDGLATAGRPALLYHRRDVEAGHATGLPADQLMRLRRALRMVPPHSGPAPEDGGVRLMTGGDDHPKALLPVVERRLSGVEADDYRMFLESLSSRKRVFLMADGSKLTRARLRARARTLAMKAASREAYARGWDTLAAQNTAGDWFSSGF